MRYELTDLKLFLAIAEARSLSAGASSLHITASSASYRIKNLEQALGTYLFLRSARGMDLTPAGEVLARHVRGLLAGVERMHDEVGRFSAGLKGQIRILANSSSLNGFIIPAVSGFLVSNPNVNIDLEERASAMIPAAIAAGEADIGVLAGSVDASGVDVLRYAVDTLILVVPVNHPLAREKEVRFGAALDFDFICMEKHSSNFLFLREVAQRAGKNPNVRIHAHSFEAVLALVAGGVGIALVPESVAAASLREGKVTKIGLLEPWALRELNLILKSGEQLPSFTAAFIQFLMSE
ncbi:LysR family transcriptional regulator [Herbaspirillum sp. GCM10030257]|uniref:LysR family transcriptional regulator n=1 Tax=Herbaspirillum sp. GCM10030257 TaxID=3273393 RepID=UPI00361186BD